MLVVLQLLISAFLSAAVMSSSASNRVLDACLGNYEQHFEKSNGFRVCIIGGLWQKIMCRSSVILHLLFSSNILELYFLYVCCKTIKDQTKKSEKLIGKKEFEVRKRYAYFITLSPWQVFHLNVKPKIFWACQSWKFFIGKTQQKCVALGSPRLHRPLLNCRHTRDGI